MCGIDSAKTSAIVTPSFPAHHPGPIGRRTSNYYSVPSRCGSEPNGAAEQRRAGGINLVALRHGQGGSGAAVRDPTTPGELRDEGMRAGDEVVDTHYVDRFAIVKA